MTRNLLTAVVLILCVATMGVAFFSHNDNLSAQDLKSKLDVNLDEPDLAPPTPINDFVPFNQPEQEWTNQNLGGRSLESQYLKLASEFSKLANAADLERLAEELRMKIAEEKAARKMVEINKLLKQVVAEFPGTNGAKYAQHMLDGNECAGKTTAVPIEPEVLQPAPKTPVKEPAAPPLAEPPAAPAEASDPT